VVILHLSNQKIEDSLKDRLATRKYTKRCPDVMVYGLRRAHWGMVARGY